MINRNIELSECQEKFIHNMLVIYIKLFVILNKLWTIFLLR